MYVCIIKKYHENGVWRLPRLQRNGTNNKYDEKEINLILREF